ncbi:MAG: hypothetical protein U0324_11160 [Polyangiales bacterium]
MTAPPVQVVDPGVPGLAMVLGGGVSLLKRTPNAAPSGTLLIRGAPGAGKSLLGLHVAVGVADALGGDVCCACVEILPVELHAQAAPFGLSERFVEAPFPPPPGEASGRARIFAGLLDLGARPQEQENLGAALSALIGAAGRGGAKPRVLVIDSLSDGYGLGGSAPRDLADAVCKLAGELGLYVILLEEAVAAKPTVWSFAVDAVFELAVLEDDARDPARTLVDRRLRVIKNRFGEADASVHRLAVSPGEFRVLPWPSSYLRADFLATGRPSALRKPFPVAQPWPFPEANGTWPEFRQCVTAVFGPETHEVTALALRLGAKTREGRDAPGRDVRVDLGSAVPREVKGAPTEVISVGRPHVNGHRWVASVWAALERVSRDDEVGVRRVILGDLRVLRTFQHPHLMWSGVYAVAGLCRALGVPLVAYATAEPRVTYQALGVAGAVFPSETMADHPPVVDIADVVIEVRSRSAMQGEGKMAGANQHVQVAVSEVYAGRRLREFVPWPAP